MPTEAAALNPLTDERRLEQLHGLALLVTSAEEGFDRLARIAKLCLDVPVAMVSLVDRGRSCPAVQPGDRGPAAVGRATFPHRSFCHRVVETGRPVVVSDASVEPAATDGAASRAYGVVAYAGHPLVTPDGEVLGVFAAIDVQPRQWSDKDLAVLQDLAGAATAQVQLRQTTAAAEAANRDKDRFLAMLSHELRTPLSPVLLLSAAIADDPALPDGVRADARTISRNVRQQTRLVDDLLDVTRIENGKVSLASALVDLNGLLAEVVVDSKGEADRKRVAVDVPTPPARLYVNGDAGRLRQVFGNLVRNAVKFTPAGGRVTVSTGGGGAGGGVAGGGVAGRAVVTVADTGIGVDAAVLPRLFDAFEQGPRSITDEFSGLGLGLAIAKGLVDAHGGTVAAASDGPGRGTTFTVDLPAAPPPAAPAPVAMPSTAPAGVDILLVEDHRDTLMAMTRLLRRLGHRVTGADSMRAARDAAARQPFDLLISDVELPDGTGLDLMRQLSAAKLDRPLRGIALTGYGMESDLKRSEDAGFFAHLVKPINFAHLEEAIRRAKP